MPSFFQWVPVLVLASGVIVWGLRLEGLVRVNQATAAAIERAGTERHEALCATLKEHFATKNEVSILKGSIDTLSPQLQDVKGAVTRIENKVDAFLVAALSGHQLNAK